MHKLQYQVKDLGELVGDVLLFGGPYSNLQASQALLDIAQKLEFPKSNRICTGDVIAYCANPVDTLAIWRTQCELVAGNCEKQLGSGAENCGCGFEVGSACDMLAKGWYPYANKSLNARDRAFLDSAPDVLIFSHAGKSYAVIHGGLTEVARYHWPVSSDLEFAEELDCIVQAVGSVDCVIAGHCGVAFEREIEGVRWVNAGAIGMPENDGTPETRYCVLSEKGIQIQKLNYDHQAASAAMDLAGLRQGYQLALVSGYWPSEDVLPHEMRRHSSAAIG